jgi:type II secretory ATPase GspE/PulE/Tfp pilus assembly ATPase PilB-like protein
MNSKKLSPREKSVEDRLKVDQMLALIDSILPFEACLYHQVIPLSVEGAYLNLGMVNPEDAASIDYVRQQVSYINCSLVTWPITADWHRDMLSKYLSHAAKGQSDAGSLSRDGAHSRRNPSKRLNDDNQSDRATYVVDSPEEITDNMHPPAMVPSQGNAQPAQSLPHESASNAGLRQSPDYPLQLELPQESHQNSLSELGMLSPNELVAELLKRVLAEGIGRLFLERQSDHGRVLWSKDGVVQLALENLSLDMLQSLISELKRLTHLPLLPATQPQQAEIERWHENQRILIRFRVMPGNYGEEATLQVLRGAALKFYQQQQINQMGHDALGMAHNLQKRVHEIRNRARQTIGLEPMSANTLTAISGLLKDIDVQLEQLIHPAQGSMPESRGDTSAETHHRGSET